MDTTAEMISRADQNWFLGAFFKLTLCHGLYDILYSCLLERSQELTHVYEKCHCRVEFSVITCMLILFFCKISPVFVEHVHMSFTITTSYFKHPIFLPPWIEFFFTYDIFI